MPETRSRISSDHPSLTSTSSHNGITTSSITGKVTSTSSGRSSVSMPNTPPPVEIPNVPSRDVNLRRALGNAIVAASTGIAAVSINPKNVARMPKVSDRPDTAISGLSVSAIPLTVKSKNVLHKVCFFTLLKFQHLTYLFRPI
uniref:UCR_Fe-S_N domain-containing protein n=1 Tax=Panagrellus redivivus TaxID=6233 RepID=A0A7E4UTP0_PANRE